MSASPAGELRAPTIEQIREARERLRGLAVETPLLRLNWEPAVPRGAGASSAGEGKAAQPADSSGAFPEIYLKLENLQPIGSFKVRGAANAILQADRDVL